MNNNTLPDNNQNINIKLFLLDPLSVIIKLAILSNKPIGTKIFIQNNVIYFHEPGIFQSLCRLVSNSNKTDIQYMYNPIEYACKYFLSNQFTSHTPEIENIFNCALIGLKKLMETYKLSPIIVLCLNYFYAIISIHLEQTKRDTIFYKDSMTYLYTKELLDTLNGQWNEQKIKVILDLISFLSKDACASNNVKSLENIMENNDKNTQILLENI